MSDFQDPSRIQADDSLPSCSARLTRSYQLLAFTSADLRLLPPKALHWNNSFYYAQGEYCLWGYSIPRSLCCSAQSGFARSWSETSVKRLTGRCPVTSFSTIAGERNAERQMRETSEALMPNISQTSRLLLYVPEPRNSTILRPRPSRTMIGTFSGLRRTPFSSFATNIFRSCAERRSQSI